MKSYLPLGNNCPLRSLCAYLFGKFYTWISKKSFIAVSILMRFHGKSSK